ncbi:glyoxylate pathway regulator [Pseudohyphozyma bogoriensis]|nr:glyoxylate pathway regulator [Pseudohyphozyma bogoriensis]
MADVEKANTLAGTTAGHRTPPTAGQNGGFSHDAGGAAIWNRNITPGGHPLDQTQPAFPVYHRRFGNPAPLGLCGFALTTFVLSLVNVNARSVSTPNVVVGLGLFYGGLAQLLAGMWEFATGNTFGATAFSSYGGFWMSFAFLISDWSGIGSAYATTEEFEHAIGFFLLGWMIFTFIMFLASLKSSVALSGVFFFLTITFMLLGISKFFLTNTHIGIAGGVFGLITAFNAWYVAAANLLTPDTSYFVLPIGPLTKND